MAPPSPQLAGYNFPALPNFSTEWEKRSGSSRPNKLIVEKHIAATTGAPIPRFHRRDGGLAHRNK
jgi:hypothetical protein